jgi:hypothetical protein
LNTTSPNPTATLTATATPSDADGDTVTLTYNWTVNGTLVRSNTTTLTTDSLDLTNVHDHSTNAPITINPGDTIVVTVTPNDGKTDGTAVTATAHVNHPPVATAPVITPANPSNNSVLTATTTVSDADSDPVVLTYNWDLNGKLIHSTGPTSALSDTVDLTTIGQTVKTGDIITVSVTPNDGKINGPFATGTTTIANSAPTATVTITPNNPVTALSANPVGADADGDVVTFAYQWLRGTTPIAGETHPTLDLTTVAGGVSAGDTFAVTVTPFDGKVNGASVTSSPVTIASVGPPITLA